MVQKGFGIKSLLSESKDQIPIFDVKANYQMGLSKNQTNIFTWTKSMLLRI